MSEASEYRWVMLEKWATYGGWCDTFAFFLMSGVAKKYGEWEVSALSMILAVIFLFLTLKFNDWFMTDMRLYIRDYVLPRGFVRGIEKSA